MRFLSEKFSLNGIESDDMGVILVTFEDDIIQDFGSIYNQNLIFESNLDNRPFYSNDAKEGEDIILNLLLLDSDEVTPATWDGDEVNKIANWLISDNFQPFISEDNVDVVYYIKCTNIVKKFTREMKGYLECTFKLFNNTAYYRSYITFEVDGTKEVYLENPSNLNLDYKPIIRITNNGSESNTISLNSTELIIESLELGNTVVIDNKMKTVNSLDGRNKLFCCNRKWLCLKPGPNRITVTGKCKVEILSEFPMVI